MNGCMYKRKAILLQEVKGHGRGTIVDVGIGIDGSAGRWLILRPASLAGTWVLPMIDADHVITAKEAAHALSVRRGRPVADATVRRYLARGTISCASKVHGGRGGGGEGSWLMSRDEVWTVEFPEGGNPNWIRAYREKLAAQQQEADDADEAEETS